MSEDRLVNAVGTTIDQISKQGADEVEAIIAKLDSAYTQGRGYLVQLAESMRHHNIKANEEFAKYIRMQNALLKKAAEMHAMLPTGLTELERPRFKAEQD